MRKEKQRKGRFETAEFTRSIYQINSDLLFSHDKYTRRYIKRKIKLNYKEITLVFFWKINNFIV